MKLNSFSTIAFFITASMLMQNGAGSTDDATTQFYNLIEYFDEQGLNEKGYEYPSFYSGAKLNDDELIVYVTDDGKTTDEIFAVIEEGTKNPDIQIELVEYSYNELLRIQSQFWDRFLYIRDNPTENEVDILPDVRSASIRMSENAVILTIAGLEELDWNQLCDFLSQGGFPEELDAVKFVALEPPIEEPEPVKKRLRSQLLSLGELDGLKYQDYDVTVTDDKVARVLEDSMLIGRSKLVEITERNTIMKKDIVICDYETYLDGELYSIKQNEEFYVGTGGYLLPLEEALIGKTVGKTYELNIIMPDDYPTSKIAGKELVFKIIVKSINYADGPQLSDLTEADYREHGFASYDEYFAYLKDAITYDREYHKTVNIAYQLIDQLIERSTFALDEDEIELEYAELMISDEQMALMHNLTLEDYISAILSEDYAVYIANTRKEAANNIKRELVLNELIECFCYDITTDDVKQLARDVYRYDEDSINNRYYTVEENVVRMECFKRLIELSEKY